MKLNGKIAFISGGASGIGWELALQLSCKHKVKVWACDLNEKGLIELKNEAKKYGGLVFTETVDVTNTEQLKEFSQKIIDTEGHIDLWLNNAGIVDINYFADQTPQSIVKTLRVNLESMVVATHHALTLMEQRGIGKIVNMGSISGEVPSPYICTYTASKFGITGFSLALQEELRQLGSQISLMLVNPGFVKTPLIEKRFPEWLNFALSDVKKVAAETIHGILKDVDHIRPGLNSRGLKMLHRFFPKTSVKLSKILLTKKPSDLLFNHYEL